MRCQGVELLSLDYEGQPWSVESTSDEEVASGSEVSAFVCDITSSSHLGFVHASNRQHLVHAHTHVLTSQGCPNAQWTSSNGKLK